MTESSLGLRRQDRGFSNIILWFRILDLNALGSPAERDRHFEFPGERSRRGFGFEFNNRNALLKRHGPDWVVVSQLVIWRVRRRSAHLNYGMWVQRRFPAEQYLGNYRGRVGTLRLVDGRWLYRDRSDLNKGLRNRCWLLNVPDHSCLWLQENTAHEDKNG